MTVAREELEEAARALGRAITAALNQSFGTKKVGFCLLLFDFGGPGTMSYLSNAKREDMILALNEFLSKVSPRH